MFAAIIFSGNGWAALPDSTTYNMVKSFALPLAAALGKNEGRISISELSQLMTADEDVDMKTKPSDSAETIMSYHK